MSSWHPRLRRLAATVVLSGATGSIHAAPWYGDACPSTTVSVLPMPATARQQLVLARRSPVDEGADTTVLVTPDGRFWVARESFEDWKLPAPVAKALRADDGDWYALDQVKGLDYRFDACTQELWLDASGVAGPSNQFNIGAARQTTWTPVEEPGGHLNFDLLYLDNALDQQVSGTAELGAFSDLGHGTASMLYDGEQPVRLETQWSHDWPDAAERLTVGDAITRGGLVGQALRFGGVQWGSEFTLQPDLVTFPLPSLNGSAALPSTVDVYVNNVLRTRQDVPAGSFELSNVPVVTGSGDVQLVVRDLLGRSQVINYPFYASPSMLREGLNEYSLQAGVLREDYGYRSNSYGEAFVSARLRRGMSNEATGEVHGEVTPHQAMFGAGISVLALPLGNWSMGLAGSGGPSGSGAYTSLGVEHLAPRWNMAAQIRAATSGFAQLGDVPGALRMQAFTRLGVPLYQGSLNLSWLRDDRRDRDASSILGASYGTRVLRDWYLNAGITHIAGGDTAGTLGLTHPFGGDKTVTAQEDQGPGSRSLHRLALQRDPPSALGLGYRVAAERGSSSRTTGNLRWTGQKGTATLDAEDLNGSDSYRVGVSSGLALLGGDVFWTRPVTGSFAVVDSGAPGVRIYQDNHLAGAADEDGLLLIPGLRPFEQNNLRLEDADLPLRYAAQSLSTTVAPPVDSGVRAQFAVQDVPAVSVYVKQANGQPVPVGSMAELDGEPLDLPVGYGGQMLVEAKPGRHRLALRWSEGHCATLVVIVPDAGADLPPQMLECR